MMKSIPVWKQELSDGVHAARLASLYCCAPAETASEAARYADEVDADALSIELDQIRHLQDHGEISLPVANELRQRVYVLQMSLGE